MKPYFLKIWNTEYCVSLQIFHLKMMQILQEFYNASVF